MKKILFNSFISLNLLALVVFVLVGVSFAQSTLTNTTTISPTRETEDITKLESGYVEPKTTDATNVGTVENTKTLINTTNSTVVAPLEKTTEETYKIQTSEPTKIENSTTVENKYYDTRTDDIVKVETENTEVLPITTQAQETKIQSTSDTFEAIQTTIQDTKEELKRIVDQNIDKIISNKPKTETANIESIREGIILNIDNTLTNSKPITLEKLNELSGSIQKELDKINDVKRATTEPRDYSRTIEETFDTMSLNIEDQVKVLKAQGGDMLYKDTNNDGISDYDSVHVYSIDPIKPSPKTTFEGREITAGEKVVLGFDPTKSELIKVVPEEPIVSEITPTEGYKVEDVKLTLDKKVIISGRFLPNTYITIYIYSTPIIVTVKTDVNGEWQYTLDKELEDGKHTVYTATVNNTGKILAKSPAFGFIKTAEAAALENIPPVQIPTDNIKPEVLNSDNVYIILGSLLLVFLLAIVMIGRRSNKQSQPLLDYISLQTQRGFDKATITNELLNNGWTIEDIEGAFKILFSNK